MKKVVDWVKENKLEFTLLTFVLLVGAFLRLYKIEGYMTFLGDEGRDAVVVSRLLKYGDLILVGPGTSIGNMYLGPLYYYLIAPALFLANYSPVGPSVLVAVTGIVTIGLVYLISMQWFGRVAGFVAAFLYAISPTAIIFSHSSWNPNVMPFFALLCIYSVWRIWKSYQFGWLMVLGVSYAFVLQSHYLGLLLVPVLGLFWLFTFLKIRNCKLIENCKLKIKYFIKYSIAGLLMFLFLMSPLVIFDARHGWNNFSAIKIFFTQREQTVSIKPWKAIPNVWPIYAQYIERLPGGRDETVGKYLPVVLLILTFWAVVVTRKRLTERQRDGFLFTLVWLTTATVGLGLYKQHIYDHYYGFFFAAPFLLFGGVVSILWNLRKDKISKGILIVGFGILVFVNFLQSPIKDRPQMQMQRARNVAKEIIKLSNGEKFNFALIAERNYEAGYRYFLDMYKADVVDIDPQNTSVTLTEQLFVVCEMEKKKCDPTHNAKAQVAAFGWSKVDSEWEVYGVNLYKLVHTK